MCRLRSGERCIEACKTEILDNIECQNHCFYYLGKYEITCIRKLDEDQYKIKYSYPAVGREFAVLRAQHSVTRCPSCRIECRVGAVNIREGYILGVNLRCSCDIIKCLCKCSLCESFIRAEFRIGKSRSYSREYT